MALDAIIISDAGDDTYSKTSAMRLNVYRQTAWIQKLKALVQNTTIDDTKTVSWKNAPKLNGIYLYDQIQKQGISAEIINNFYQETQRFIGLLKQKPRYIIVSTTFVLTKPALKKLAEQIRRLSCSTTLICGGPFVYASYLLALKKSDSRYDIQSPKSDYLFLEYDQDTEPPIDYFVISPSGIGILAMLIKRLDAGKGVDDVPNIAFTKHQDYHFNTIDTAVAAYENLCIDWSALPQYLFDRQVFSLQASNGCPYQCAYCNFVKDPKATYTKPIDKTVAELKAIQGRGVRYVRFVDDNLRLGSPDLGDFCDRLIDAGNTIKWMSFLRLNNLNGVDPHQLKKAGCIEVQMGLESANALILKNMNKHIDPERYHATIQRLLAAGINVSACFIIGFPGETEQTANQSLSFIESVNGKHLPGNFTWSLYPFYLAPLSPIYEHENRKKFNLTGYVATWRHSTMDSQKANELIKKGYLQIDGSSPIYSGDDLDIIASMSDSDRKQFYIQRHQLSKASVCNDAISDRDLVASFSRYFR